jgi:hypothetical protein
MGASLYTAKQVMCVVGVMPLTDGLAEGTFVKVSPVGDVSRSIVGADGHVTIVLVNDPTWDVEITLMYGSKHNEYMSALFALHTNDDAGAAIGPFLLKDNNGATLYAFQYLVPKKHAGTEMGSEGKERTWSFTGIGNTATAISGGNAI